MSGQSTEEILTGTGGSMVCEGDLLLFSGIRQKLRRYHTQNEVDVCHQRVSPGTPVSSPPSSVNGFRQ